MNNNSVFPINRSRTTHRDFQSNPKSSFDLGILALLFTHVLLAFIFRTNTIFVTFHAYITLLIGIYFLITDKKPIRLIYIIGYITGSELIWRGLHAQIFWEIGKYSIALLTIGGLLRYHKDKKFYFPPILYFILLLPSILMMPAFNRSQIAFNLAGPFALATSVMFFKNIELNKYQLQRLFVYTLIPIVSLGVIVVLGVINAAEITFSTGSMFATSGDIGPNQVSSILGLGAFVAGLFILLEEKLKFQELLILILGVWLLTQSALTFSRGGFWTSLLSLFVAALIAIRNKRTRSLIIGVTIILLLLVSFIIYPSLVKYTSGSIIDRFTDFGTTGRLEIIKADFYVFAHHPLFGVGPHQSKIYHAIFFRYSSSHTEYSRMLSEHGIFGAVSLLIMVFMVISQVIRKMPLQSKAIKMACLAWALLYMSHSATRLVAPSILFGLAFANFNISDINNE